MRFLLGSYKTVSVTCPLYSYLHPNCEAHCLGSQFPSLLTFLSSLGSPSSIFLTASLKWLPFQLDLSGMWTQKPGSRMKAVITYSLIWCWSRKWSYLCDIPPSWRTLMFLEHQALPPGFKQKDEVSSSWKGHPKMAYKWRLSCPAPSLLRADIAYPWGASSCQGTVSWCSPT